MVDRVHPAAWDTARLLAECESRRQRRSGPGGQHRNKVETAVVITHVPTTIRGEASERRSQEENRKTALFRLRLNLAQQLRCPLDPETDHPSETWRLRCRDGKLEISPTHDDFPSLLAEALDAVFACGMEIPKAAQWLGCTNSQLIRFLKREPRALAQVNVRRRDRGLHPLR